VNLTLLAEQEKVEGFLKNVRNVDRLGDLLEDIRDAIMDYQVCVSLNYTALRPLIFDPDSITARNLRQVLSTHCESLPSSLVRVN
jgi:hypothetical protein